MTKEFSSEREGLSRPAPDMDPSARPMGAEFGGGAEQPPFRVTDSERDLNLAFEAGRIAIAATPDDGWGIEPRADARAATTDLGNTVSPARQVAALDDAAASNGTQMAPDVPEARSKQLENAEAPPADGWGTNTPSRDAPGRRPADVPSFSPGDVPRERDHQELKVVGGHEQLTDDGSEGELPPPEKQWPALSEADVDAVTSYTRPAGDYLSLNRSLREGVITELEMHARESHDFSQALGRLPETHDIVYRKVAGTLPQEVIDRYTPGEIVVENNYTSASHNPELDWGEGNVRWVIASKHGREVGELSAVPTEQEVVFDRFSRFAVLDRNYDRDEDRWTIFMREL